MQSDVTQTSTVLTFFHTFLVMADGQRGLGRLDVEYASDEEEEGQARHPPTRVCIILQCHQGGTNVLDRPQLIAATPSDYDRGKTDDGAICPLHPEHLRGGEVNRLQ